MTERFVLQQLGLDHVPFRLALATDIDLRKVAAGAALVHPELAHARASPAVHKGPPINVANVSRTASAHKTHGDHGSFLLVLVDEFALRERLPMHEHPRGHRRAAPRNEHVRGDERFRTLPVTHSRLRGW